eukprot:934469-Amphidinium_carterae.1
MPARPSLSENPCYHLQPERTGIDESWKRLALSSFDAFASQLVASFARFLLPLSPGSTVVATRVCGTRDYYAAS